MSNPSHPENQGPQKDPQSFSQEVKMANIGARVPEKVARGVFTTGALVLQGQSEFILDFVLRMNQPHQVAARVIVPLGLMPQLIEALKTNLENYKKQFNWNPPAMPTPPPGTKPPSIEEIYQDLKMGDDVMVGAYANSVMVVHTPSDFCLEFISNFYPKACITARVFMSAPQIPVLVNTLSQSWNNMQAKIQQQQQQKPPL